MGKRVTIMNKFAETIGNALIYTYMGLGAAMVMGFSAAAVVTVVGASSGLITTQPTKATCADIRAAQQAVASRLMYTVDTDGETAVESTFNLDDMQAFADLVEQAHGCPRPTTR